MIVSFSLKNQIIRRMDSNTVVAQSKNYLRAKFNALTGDWNGPITAIFNEYTVLLDDNHECVVPWEVLQKPGIVKVSAFCGDLHTASVATMEVNPSGYIDGQTPEPPTPDVYAQLTGLVQNAVDTANSVQQRADAGDFDGERGPQGPKGEKGDKGDKGDQGIPGEVGPTGATGPKGERGEPFTYEDFTPEQLAALTGPIGPAGAPGPQGEPGPEGPKGETGPQGPAGLDAPQIDDTQASPTNPWSGAKTAAELAKKLDTNQGAENAGKVLGIGDDGGVVPVDASSGIDDTKITTANPWSSAKIVETVCPPFEVTGPIVTCNPVEGYPLHVVSQIVSVQEGEGDPSPDNIRPITGWTEANLLVGGVNLFDGAIYGSKNISGVTIDYDPETQVFTFNGTTNSRLNNQAFGVNIPGYGKQFTVSVEVLSGTVIGDGYAVAYFGAADFFDESNNFMDVSLFTSGSRTKRCQYKYLTSFWFYVDKGITFDNLKVKIQLEVGNQASPYTPYNPASKTITLPFGQTVYGGTLDWTTGVLTVTHAEIASYNGEDLPGYWISDRDIYSKDTTPTTGAQVVYELSEPQTVQLTPQEILALSGVNTIYTDTGDTTVSGRADQTTIINQLAARIAALESAATNI